MAKIGVGVKLFLLFITVGIFTSSAAVYWGYKNAKDSLGNQTLAHLVSIRDIKRSHLEAYFREKLGDTEVMAQDSVFIKYAKIFAGIHPSKEGYGKLAENFKKLLEDLNREAGANIRQMRFHDIFIIDTEGNIIFTVAKEDDLGTNLIHGKYKETALAKVFRRGQTQPTGSDIEFYEPSQEKISAFFAAPMLDRDEDVVGVLATQINMKEIDDIMQERSGLGETGDTYLVGPDFLLRSDSRFFEERTVLKLKVGHEAARRAIAGKIGTMWANNYRDVPVLSAYTPLGILGLKWGFVAEIDVAEVLAPVLQLRRQVLTGMGLLVLLLAGASHFLSRKIATPITNLSDQLNKMSATGEYGETLPVTSHDEIGSLIQSFNEMSLTIESRTVSKDKLAVIKERYDLSSAVGKVGTWDWNPATGELVWNDETYRILGLTNKEITPSFELFLDLVHPEDRDSLNRAVEDALRKKKPYDVDCRIILQNGEKRTCHATGEVTFDDEGNPLRMLGTFQDITERKRVEDSLKMSEAKTRAIVASIGEGIISTVATPDMTIDFVNQEACNIFGYLEEELVGQRLTILMPEKYRSAHMAGTKRYLSEGNPKILGKRLELEGLRKDGSTFPMELQVEEAKGGQDGNAFFTAAIRDITDRKKVEEKLLHAKETAEEATKLKDKFVSFVSHDLQSPLATLLGFLKLIRDDEAEVPNKGVKQMLVGAIKTGDQMSTLINDLLSMSRLKTGALQAKPKFFDAKLIGAKVSANFEYLAKEKGIELTNTIPNHSRIYADDTLLTQAVQNLVNNSIKFCKKGGRITIFMADNEKSTICVKDTGTGIKVELLDKIFEYGDEASRKGTAGEAGTGLGLPFAKEIVEAHGGELTLETEEGKGCLFSIKLPHARPQILIVDDDSNFSLMLAKYLKKLDVDIIEAVDGEVALKEVERNPPHLIITDIEMPVMDGLELVRRLQDKEETKSIPIIVVSGKHGMEIRDEVFELGAKDFVTKESVPDELIPRVRRFIS